MDEDIGRLEVVYYASAIPHHLAILTFLGLIFDRVHFPNVHIPTTGFDPEWVAGEIKRIEELPAAAGGPRYETWLLVQLMRYALIPELREFCHFTGTKEQVFGGDAVKGAKELVYALYEQMYGRKEGFEPIFDTGCSKGLGGDASLDYPGAFYYPANALLYAAQHGIPLLNADPTLPVPAFNAESARNNSKLLSAVMAMECVRLVLPDIGELQPMQILEARADLAKHVQQFRFSVLRLAGKLNIAIGSTADSAEIVRAAEFIARTEVYPSLMELKSELEKPRKGWKDRSWDLAKRVPELAGYYASFNLAEAIPRTITALGDWLVDGFSREKPRSDLYFLLKLKDRARH